MAARLDYRWHLRQVMATCGMFSTTDLIGPLADRDITLSSSQVYRLVTDRPERLSLKILMALLDILDCAMDDLIEPVPAAGADRKKKASAAGPGGPGPGDPVGSLLALMEELEPALSRDVVLGALEQSAARPDGRRRIAAAVTGQPNLLAGQGARAPFPGVLRFISALDRAGAAAVVEPSCPRCGRQRQLVAPIEGLRVCGGCRSKARSLRCGSCGKVSSVARRNDGGKPICQNCWHRDPRSWKPCARSAMTAAIPSSATTSRNTAPPRRRSHLLRRPSGTSPAGSPAIPIP
jgi:DNA-binding Xre family transcriptional regulator